MTQSEMILNHLQQWGKINPLQALKDYGCFRLSDRIFNLRKAGYIIVTERKKNGVKGNTFAEYHYKGNINQPKTPK